MREGMRVFWLAHRVDREPINRPLVRDDVLLAEVHLTIFS
jgi:hypothetical protein